MQKNQFAREIIKEFPDCPNRTLARTLVNRHPKLFSNLEMARTAIRIERGASGTRLRKHATAKQPIGWQNLIPTSIAKKLPAYNLPRDTKTLILSDIHIPFHDDAALVAAMEFGIKNKCDQVLLNGDIIDNYATSRWEPDPRLRDPQGELDATRAFLASVKKAFPKAKVFYKHGNHEDRWELYMRRNAPILLEVDEFQLGKLLDLEGQGITEIATRQIMHLGKLTVLHGHELPRGISSPVNPARTLYMRLAATSLMGHLHQRSMHTESGGYPKKHITTWSTGCLCDMTPEYATINKWSHGGAIVDCAKDGNFDVNNFGIIDGRVYD